MVDLELKTKILFEISEIDELLSKSSLLLQKCQIHEPDFIELSAVGSTIHSFYNGLENIFLMIQKNIDKKISTKERWHSELLLSMFDKNDNRKALLRESLKNLYLTIWVFVTFLGTHMGIIFVGIWQNRFLKICNLFGRK